MTNEKKLLAEAEIDAADSRLFLSRIARAVGFGDDKTYTLAGVADRVEEFAGMRLIAQEALLQILTEVGTSTLANTIATTALRQVVERTSSGLPKTGVRWLTPTP